MITAHRLPCTRAAAARVALASAAGLLSLLAAQPSSSADATLDTAEGHATLQEAGFALDIELSGSVALVSAQQLIANTGSRDEQAVYTFDLPVDAAVTGLDIRLADGRTSTLTIADIDAAQGSVTDPGAFNAMPDPGLLRLVSRDLPEISGVSPYARATYELRVHPVPPGKVVTVTTRWVAPLSYQDGRLSLRIPRRGEASNLVREQVRLTMTPPAGASGFAAVHGGGKLLPSEPKGLNGKRQATFTAPPRADLVIDAMPAFPRGAGPQVSFATIPIRDDFGAIGLSVLSPLPSAGSQLMFERLLLVIDVSRSLGPSGLVAAARVADTLLASMPENTAVEAVLFDRTARRVFGSFSPGGAEARKKVARALMPGAMENGSELGEALAMAHDILKREKLAIRPAEGLERGVRASTLMVLLSDGMTPLGLTGRSAANHLSDEVLRDLEVFSVTLVPDEAPVPEVATNAAAELAFKAGGRAIAMRFAEAETRAKNLPFELGQPAPLRRLAVSAGSVILDKVTLPTTLKPGQGLVAIGLYRGPAPKRLSVSAEQRNQHVHIEGKRELGLGRATLALAVAGAIPEDFLPGYPDSGTEAGQAGNPVLVHDAATLAQARRALVRAASLATTVTRYSAAVAVEASDRFAQDRLALAKKWGPSAFFRLPPAPEQRPGFQLREYTQQAATSGGADSAHRRTGELDRDIISRLISTYLAPKARTCYEKALRRNPTLRGSLTVVFEVARGEVQHARVESSSFPNVGIEACVMDAAYSIQVPAVAIGDDPETTAVVRYPVSFKKRKKDDSQVDEQEAEPLPALDVPLERDSQRP